MKTYQAWTWLGGCHTGVQRGPMRGVAFDVATCSLVPRLSFFFFFFLDLRRPSSICVDSASICTEPGKFSQNQAVSAELGRIGWPSKWPKLALNHARTAKIGFKWDPNILNLSFLNFILNICCFFFVLCLLPSSFFVLWIKA